MLYTLFAIAYLLIAVCAIPIPLVVTQTAPAIIVTDTATTKLTTVVLPTLHLLVSNGITYTVTPTATAAAAVPTEATAEQKAVAATTAVAVANAGAGETVATTAVAKVDETTTTPTTTSQTTANAPAAELETTTSAAPANPETATISGTTTSAAVTTPETTTSAAATTPGTTGSPATSSSPAASQTTVTTQAPVTAAATTSAVAQAQAQAETSSSSSSSSSSSTGALTSSSTSELTATLSSGSISAPNTIVYSPYTDSGSCKDANTIKSDLDFIKSKGISKLRIYGTDCGNFDTILPYAISKGLTVNQGLWISSAGVDSIDSSLNDIILYGKASGWDVFDFITVGNEAVNSNYCSVSDLIAKIKSVKSQLSAAGYSGKVTTSEPPVTFIKSPSLCTSSGIDFVGINPHSYFNTELTAQESGEYVSSQKSAVELSCGGMTVYITETGYPSQGDTNGKNVPSAANQKDAIASIIKSTGGDCTILTTYNDFWKEPGPYGIEQYFGAIDLFA